jgi:hypothetical protein
VGLAVGIACCALILLWAEDELRYDRFHQNADEMYSIVGDDGLLGKTAPTCGPIANYEKGSLSDLAVGTACVILIVTRHTV